MEDRSRLIPGKRASGWRTHLDASTKSQLARIEAQLNQNLATLAMDSLGNMLRRLPYEELALAKPDVEELINRFFPKRRRELRVILGERLQGASRVKRHSVAESFADKPSTAPRPADNALGQRVIAEDQDSKRLEYSARLNDLRDRHIFQWSTAYRETITYMFKELRLALSAPGPEDAQLKTLSSLLEEHSTNIFQRGYDHIRNNLSAAHGVAVAKSISGLQRFLFLVIDAHASAASDSSLQRRCRCNSSCFLGDAVRHPQRLRTSAAGPCGWLGTLTRVFCPMGSRDGVHDQHRSDESP